MTALQSVEQVERSDRPGTGGGTLQGVVLSLLAVLPTMGAVLIVPILPLFARSFGAFPGIGFIAPVILTLPALCIGVLSPAVGAAADRYGRRRLLIYALIVYALAGTAPAFLNSVPLIIASRFVVGTSEAVIMTCCTTLIGDYFTRSESERWLSYQSAVIPIGATVLFVVGGMLGNLGWRAPFFAYAAALPLAILAVLTLPEPRAIAAAVVGRAFPWKPFRRFIVLGTVAGVAIFAIPIQIGFILGGIGIDSPQTIGLLAALDGLAMATGAIAFQFASRLGFNRLIAVAAIVAGCGFLCISRASSIPPMLLGLILNGLGSGLLIPTLLAMTMEQLPFELRGRGMGIYMGAFFIGQFVSPIVVTVLAKQAGGLLGAIAVFGYVGLIAGLAGIAVLYRNRAFRVPLQRTATVPHPGNVGADVDKLTR